MLSALAKYIFGGIVGDDPEPTVQCETREVNDWLLINMPDQVDKDVDFDFDSEDDVDMDHDSNSEDDVVKEYDFDQDDNDSYVAEIVAEYESDAKLDFDEDDEDEILTALPLLLQQENDCDVVCSYRSTAVVDSPSNLSEQTRLLLKECFRDFQVLPESLYINHSLYYPSDYSVVINRCFSEITQKLRRANEAMRMASEYKLNPRKFRPIYIRADKVAHEFDRRENHPAAYPRNYINHRSPVLSPKTAHLEQLKDLKPAQRVAEYNMKKCISRSQLNKQNKNYIYECSTKTNRRKNLQRHHSGANNNRKC